MNPGSIASVGSRRLAVAAALLAFCAAGPSQGAHVASLSGEVEIGRGEPPVWQPARAGDALAPGDSVRTGREGRAELALDAATVRLYGDSLLRLPPDAMGADGARAVELEQGLSLFDVLHRSGDDRFEVRTREVVVSVKGTRFSVDAGEEVAVSVYRGLVGVLAGESVHETLVREGFAAVGGREHPFELFLHEGLDPWESWTQGTLPPPLREAALPQAPPARLDVDAAAQAARRSFEADAVRAAMERRPEVAERVAELSARGDAALQEGRDLEPAPEPERDPVLDAPEDTRESQLEIPFAEAWIASQGPNGSGGSTAADLPFRIDVVDGLLGGDLVVLTSEQSGQTWSFDLVELKALDAGTAILPTTLESELRQEGVDDPAPLVDMMLQIAGGS